MTAREHGLLALIAPLETFAWKHSHSRESATVLVQVIGDSCCEHAARANHHQVKGAVNLMKNVDKSQDAVKDSNPG